MHRVLSVALFVAGFAVGCLREAPPVEDEASTLTGKLTIVGSSTMAPLMADLAKSFQAIHPRVQIGVQSGGTGRGIIEARAGTADIGMVSRALVQKERDLVGFSIARDGVCLLVHKENPVQALTSAQIVDIFKGKVANWKALGGSDAPINVITREEGRSSLEVFTHHFGLAPADIKAAATAGENEIAFNAVAGDRNAITYISVAESERRAAAGGPVKLIVLDGVAATSENVRSGKYPLSRSLTLVTQALPTGVAKAFIDFALSPQAAPIIKRYDFVSYVD